MSIPVRPPALPIGVDSPAYLGCCYYPPFPEIPAIPGTVINHGLLLYHVGDVLVPKPGWCGDPCAPLPRVCTNVSTCIADGRMMSGIGDYLNIPANCVHVSVPTPTIFM
jgi:hypothetical protein